MLKTQDLKAFYGKAQILNGVNIEFNKGEAIAILGPNGTGKTALIRAILDLVKKRREGASKWKGHNKP